MSIPNSIDPRLGTIARAVMGLDWSRDGRSVTVTTSDLHGDIWLARNAVPRR